MKTQPKQLLSGFREYLIKQLGNKNTADRYYFALCRFFRESEIDEFGKVTPELVLDGLQRERGRNGCSALKLGLLHLHDYNHSVDIPGKLEMDKIQHGKRDRSVLPPKTIYQDEVERKIMRLRDRKYKYGYRLMMVSGLRVSELAALEKEDIQLTPDGLEVNVRHGKGGSNGLVRCMADPYLEKRLPGYLSALQEDETPFYAAPTMKKKAWELGIECHDFRRIAAIQYRRQQMEEREQSTALEVSSVQEIDDQTREFLRHERFSTTKRYLYNRKLRVKMPGPSGTE